MVVISHNDDLFNESSKKQYGVLLTSLLAQLDLKDLETEIEKQYYAKNVSKKFHYRIELLLKLVVFMRYHKLSYRTVISRLTEDDIKNLLTKKELEQMKKGTFSLPSPSTLHYFITYRLKEEGVNRVMNYLGSKILHHVNLNQKDPNLNQKDPDTNYGIIDSTPLEASRYSKYATFNKHYNMHMCKAHIISTSGYPLYMIFSEGTESDEKYGLKLIENLKSMKPTFDAILCDGGYDSFQMHATIFGELGSKPVIEIRDNAVIHTEASEERIHKVVNSHWRNGGDTSATLQEQLKFLYNFDASSCKNPEIYKEIIGKYLRNQNLQNSQDTKTKLKKRGRCEEMHSQLKAVLKFNVKGYRKEHRSLYTKLDVITAQCMYFTYLQNNSTKKALAGYL